MRGASSIGRRRIQMLHDLAKDDGFAALKRAAEIREEWRRSGRIEKETAVRQKTIGDGLSRYNMYLID